jgi:uncharacterized membrane protein YfcA
MLTLLLLFGAGLLAGAMNSLAGGGSFVTLPALIGVGVPSVEANASSTVALWPGGAAGAWTYFVGLRPVCRVGPWPMLAVTIVGSVLGSLLLLWTPSSAFDVVLPWLLLLATLAMAFGRRVGAALQGLLRSLTPLVLVAQFALGVYGGYFGGAVGLMMVAAWSLFGESEVKSLNAPRTLFVTAANSVATLAFVAAGAVRWPQTLPMLAGGLLGGFAGARLGRRLPGNAVRTLTLFTTAAITCVFFVRAYL